MTRHYSLVIEGEEGSYSAYVPELPAILITGKAMNELTARAVEAIELYLITTREDPSPTAVTCEIEVELPA